MTVTVGKVDETNWRDVVSLEVAPDQKRFVAQPAYYLCLCFYGNLWKPMAVSLDDRVVGFMMWAIDPDDGSCWLGGILIDQGVQGRGYGTRAVRAAIDLLREKHGVSEFALSYEPENTVARHIYRSIGFRETGETEGEEVVARLTLS